MKLPHQIREPSTYVGLAVFILALNALFGPRPLLADGPSALAWVGFWLALAGAIASIVIKESSDG